MDAYQWLFVVAAISAMYIAMLAPIALLAGLFYRWCVALHEVMLRQKEVYVTRHSDRIVRGHRLFRETLSEVRPPWYVLALPILVLPASFVFLNWENGSSDVLTWNLHMCALVICIVFSTILALLSGSLVLAPRIKRPGKLLFGSCVFVLLLFVLLWLITPRAIFEATYPHRWTNSGGNVYREEVLVPLTFPFHSAAIFIFSFWFVGGTPRGKT